MRSNRRICCGAAGLFAVVLWTSLQAANAGPPEEKAPRPGDVLPQPRAVVPAGEPSSSIHSILDNDTSAIDLASTRRLAGVQNPETLLARERVTEAVAVRQLAAAQILPNLNAGTSLDIHNGPLQRSTGVIEKVNRGSLYLGLGASAVGAGT